MKFKKVVALAVLASAVMIQGCTTHLSQGQKREMSAFKEKGLMVTEKSAGTAAILGIFPMVGYFYAGHPVLAFTTLPLYPFLGPLWMPFDTSGSVKNLNYYATKEHVSRSRSKELKLLDQRLQDKEIVLEQHIREQRLIEEKYEPY